MDPEDRVFLQKLRELYPLSDGKEISKTIMYKVKRHKKLSDVRLIIKYMEQIVKAYFDGLNLYDKKDIDEYVNAEYFNKSDQYKGELKLAFSDFMFIKDIVDKNAHTNSILFSKESTRSTLIRDLITMYESNGNPPMPEDYMPEDYIPKNYNSQENYSPMKKFIQNKGYGGSNKKKKRPSRRKSSKRKSLKRKSLKRKSLKRKSLKRKSSKKKSSRKRR